MSRGDSGVTFSRFSVGLRFSHADIPDASPDALWNILFSSYAPQDMAGAHLFFFENCRDRFDREDCSILALSTNSLKCSTLLYQKLQLNERIRSFLTLQRPIVQSNYMEKAGQYAYLGKVQPDGSVAGGTSAFGNMRFSGRVFAPLPPIFRMRFLLICDAAYGHAPFSTLRILLRSFAEAFPNAHFMPILLTDGGVGSTEALLFDCDGKYVPCAGEYEDDVTPAYFGLLPLGHTGVVEAENTEERLRLLSAALERGCHRIYCARVSAAEETIMRASIPADAHAELVFLSSAQLRSASRLERCYREATGVILCLPDAKLFEETAACLKRPMVKNYRMDTDLDMEQALTKLIAEMRSTIR